MATRVTRSQTHAIGPNPPLSLRYNPFSAFGSNQRGAEIVDQFLSFSARRATPLISQNRLPPESPTPAAHIVVLPDNYKSPESKDHLFSRPAAFDGGRGGPRFPGDSPPGPPSDDDDPNFPDDDLFAQDPNSDKELLAEQIPTDTLAQLASAINNLAHYSRRPSSDSTPRTKVREPDQFDGTDP